MTIEEACARLEQVIQQMRYWEGTVMVSYEQYGSRARLTIHREEPIRPKDAMGRPTA